MTAARGLRSGNVRSFPPAPPAPLLPGLRESAVRTVRVRDNIVDVGWVGSNFAPAAMPPQNVT
jgi:hypothetical protein